MVYHGKHSQKYDLVIIYYNIIMIFVNYVKSVSASSLLYYVPTLLNALTSLRLLCYPFNGLPKMTFTSPRLLVNTSVSIIYTRLPIYVRYNIIYIILYYYIVLLLSFFLHLLEVPIISSVMYVQSDDTHFLTPNRIYKILFGRRNFVYYYWCAQFL